MSTSSIWVGIAAIIILGVVGVMAWQSVSQPTSDSLAPSPVSSPVSSGSQFLQEAPDGTLPVTSPSSSLTATPAATARSVEISIEDTGFNPRTVTVAAGTTVTFVNNGQALHWPASAVHPTHQQLPGFDAMRGLATGESYSFVFSQSGTWTFHDHLQPTVTGSVVVQ